MDRSITVTGHAEVKKEPELAYMNLTVSAHELTAKVAQETQSQLMSAVLATLDKLGVPAKARKTQNFRTQQLTNYDQKKQKHVPNGFQTTQSLLVTVEANEAEQVVGALGSMGEGVQLSIGFGLKNHDAETNEALCLAIENAKQKATAMAIACGATLGNVISCQEGGGHRGGAPRAMAVAASAEMGGGSAPELPMGEIEIHAMVTMQFALNEQGGEVPA